MKKYIFLFLAGLFFIDYADCQVLSQNVAMKRATPGISVNNDDFGSMLAKKRRKKRRSKGKKGKRGGPSVQTAVKINPAGALYGDLPLTVEHAINNNISAALSLSYLMKYNSLYVNHDYKGFAIAPEARYYFQGGAPGGFYGAAYLQYQSWTEKVTGDLVPILATDSLGLDPMKTELKNKISGFGGGLQLGYQFILGDMFTVDVFGGGGFVPFTKKYDEAYDRKLYEINKGYLKDGEKDPSGFTPRFGISIGIAF